MEPGAMWLVAMNPPSGLAASLLMIWFVGIVVTWIADDLEMQGLSFWVFPLWPIYVLIKILKSISNDLFPKCSNRRWGER